MLPKKIPTDSDLHAGQLCFISRNSSKHVILNLLLDFFKITKDSSSKRTN